MTLLLWLRLILSVSVLGFIFAWIATGQKNFVLAWMAGISTALLVAVVILNRVVSG